ncbi:CHAT domain-containing protein [Ornithinimicrobium pratense]|uniref:CHAT domain-containing protein n=1 Tax=Ornithinimicrobium pratense TaxID=2593973 RepID=A0A5J6V240_9MICO|nr:CHAT domain-containing protein [Ornithinimicrobium pratense]QFG67758.1 CHAT domain-containing protein [Ornithinimicrobium pratense]
MVEPSTRGEQVWSEARRLNDLGDFRAAAQALDDARRVLSEAPAGDLDAARMLVRVDVTGALTALELDGYAAASDLLRAARLRAGQMAAPDLVALTHIQHGVVEARSGSWARAREELLAAMELRDHLGAVEQCSTLITLGLTELSLRRLTGATSHLEQARALAAAHDLDAHLFKATHNLGCVHFVAGDVPRALALMAEADAMPVQVSRDRAHLDHAEALLDAGLVQEADDLLQTALTSAKTQGHRLDEGDILLDLARCALLRGERDTARHEARRAVAAFRSRQASSRRALAELFLAGLDLADGAPAERALAAAALWEGTDPHTAEQVEAALLTAEAEIARDRPQVAQRRLDRLGPASSLRLPVQLHAHHLRALVADRVGDDEEFAKVARQASDALATAQSSLRSLELRAAVTQHAARLAQLDLARAVRHGSAAACIETVERWRGASTRAEELTLSADDETASLLQELRWLASGMSTGAPENPAEREARMADLQQRITARARLGRRASDGPVLAALTCDQLLAALPAGTAYLTFGQTGGRMYAAVANGSGQHQLHDVGPEREIEDAVATVRRDLRGQAFAGRAPGLQTTLAAALEESGARLGRLLLDPLADVVGSCDRLVIAPNRTLHALAWACLPQVARRPVTVTPSASRWVRHLGDGPVALRRVSAHAGPGLPEATGEVGAVRRTWGAEAAATTGPGRATTRDVARALAEDDLVHVAAHGQHAGDNPLFSSLRLHDGPLYAHDLVPTVHARHVVLSACDVGRARIRSGGEALGMTAALLSLGAWCVVAAVAPLADTVSAQAATLYHEQLAAGADAAAALAAAVRDTPGAQALMCFGSDLQIRR